ncbi:MAG: methyltransferase domain-containing protein [Ktedonobacterales bacterium]
MVSDLRGDDIEGLDHVQVAAPRDAEAAARAFYGGVLGLREIAKPAALVGRGGAWFAVGDRDELHVGLEDEFQPQRKAHPAFRVRDLAAVRQRLVAAGRPIAESVPIPGRSRFETSDPFGNRLEFVRLEHDAGEAIRERTRQQFAPVAAAYVASEGHAHGDDLARLVALAQPRASDVALDIATGGGHTALALALHVAHVTATDLTPDMLAAARQFIAEQGVRNVDFVVADAERLPFLDASFDLVTVRIAPHHFASVTSAVREMARVLTPDGRLVVIDNIAPEDPALDALLNTWEARRDPSHVRAYTASEWQAFVAASGLSITTVETEQKAHDFAAWAERMRMPAAEQAALERNMLAAPAEARAHFGMVEEDGRLLRWSGDYLVLAATKPAEAR